MTGAVALTVQAQPRPAKGRPLTVMHLLPDLAVGGGQMVVVHAASALMARGVKVEVGYLRQPADLAGRFSDMGITPDLIDGGHLGRTGAVAALARRLGSGEVDVLHVHSDDDRLAGQLAALWARVPVVGHLHSAWNHLEPKLPDDAGWVSRRWHGLTAAARGSVERHTVRQYIAVSEHVGDRFRRAVPGASVTVLPHILPLSEMVSVPAPEVTTALREELELAPEARVLLYAARLTEGKGHEVLLEALATVRTAHPDVVLLLAGDGDLRPALSRKTEELGLEDNVVFLGTRRDVGDLIAISEAVTFPSNSEGAPLGVVEAMAAGRPVVGFRIPALVDMAVSGAPLNLVDQSDVAGFAREVSALLADRQRAEAMGRAGRDHVLRVYDPGVAVDALIGCYQSVALAPHAEPEVRT